jgi:CheY-like chemotaxis protein
LLLADDSAAIRKVIELTFSDEGMEVVTVPDGQSAFEKMGQVVPDLVLADVYMPGIDGYQLCRSIKQDERFSKTPVVLLISSFEPYDEAEARRAGADDVVTKPFQSIRQLVSRVGSLLSRGEDTPVMNHEYSPWESAHTDPTTPAPFEPADEPPVTVLVEAPKMDHVEPVHAGVSCSTDVELQTADTLRLQPISDEPPHKVGVDNEFQETIEVEPMTATVVEDEEPYAVAVASSHINERVVSPLPAPAMKFDDAVLDLDDEYLSEPQAASDDVFLDLDFGDTAADDGRDHQVAAEPAVLAQTVSQEQQEGFRAIPVMRHEQQEDSSATPVMVMPFDWSAAEQSSAAQPDVPAAPKETDSMLASDSALSPAVIDAIARRVVEQMSDKVIREIAWEVVPELSELLIKRKLNEQK